MSTLAYLFQHEGRKNLKRVGWRGDKINLALKVTFGMVVAIFKKLQVTFSLIS